MKHKIKYVFLSILAAALLFSACEVTLYVTDVSVSGYVYDLGDGSTITNAALYLQDSFGNNAYSGFTDVNGMYTFAEVTPGTYTLVASSTNYVYSSFSVEVESNGQVLPPIGGLSGIDDANIRLLLTWDKDFGDVDTYLSTPKGTIITQGYGLNATMNTPYSLPGLDNGFHPEESFTLDTDREIIGTSNTSTDSNEITHYEPVSNQSELIKIDSFPFTNSGVNSSSDYTNMGLTSDYGPYIWKGVMEYYAISDETDTDGTVPMANLTNTDAADAVLYVYYGKDLVGSYSLPEYTELKGASLVRINCLIDDDGDETYQIVPDIRVIQSTDDDNIRSTVSNNGIIAIKKSLGEIK